MAGHQSRGSPAGPLALVELPQGAMVHRRQADGVRLPVGFLLDQEPLQPAVQNPETLCDRPRRANLLTVRRMLPSGVKRAPRADLDRSWAGIGAWWASSSGSSASAAAAGWRNVLIGRGREADRPMPKGCMEAARSRPCASAGRKGPVPSPVRKLWLIGWKRRWRSALERRIRSCA